MLSPLLIIVFIALSIMEERKRKKENVRKKRNIKKINLNKKKIKCLILMTIMIMMQNKG